MVEQLPLIRMICYVTISNWCQLEINETAWDAVLEKYQIDTVLWVKAQKS